MKPRPAFSPTGCSRCFCDGGGSRDRGSPDRWCCQNLRQQHVKVSSLPLVVIVVIVQVPSSENISHSTKHLTGTRRRDASPIPLLSALRPPPSAACKYTLSSCRCQARHSVVWTDLARVGRLEPLCLCLVKCEPVVSQLWQTAADAPCVLCDTISPVGVLKVPGHLLKK